MDALLVAHVTHFVHQALPFAIRGNAFDEVFIGHVTGLPLWIPDLHASHGDTARHLPGVGPHERVGIVDEEVRDANELCPWLAVGIREHEAEVLIIKHPAFPVAAGTILLPRLHVTDNRVDVGLGEIGVPREVRLESVKVFAGEHTGHPLQLTSGKRVELLDVISGELISQLFADLVIEPPRAR